MAADETQAARLGVHRAEYLSKFPVEFHSFNDFFAGGRAHCAAMGRPGELRLNGVGLFGCDLAVARLVHPVKSFDRLEHQAGQGLGPSR